MRQILNRISDPTRHSILAEALGLSSLCVIIVALLTLPALS